MRTVLFLFLPLILCAQLIELDVAMKGLNTVNAMEVFEDPSGKLTINDVRNQTFKPLQKKISSMGASTSAWWVKLDVYNPSNKPIEWKVKFLYGQIDSLESWQYNKKRLLTYEKKGDHFLPEEIGFFDRLAFSYTTAPKETNSVYFRLDYETVGLIEMYHAIWSKQTFNEHNLFYAVSTTVIITSLSILFMYNFFIFIILKTKEYFWYIVYLLGTIGITLVYMQVGVHFIWNDSLYITDMSTFIVASIILIAFIQFTRSFLELNVQLPKIDTILRLFVFFVLFVLLLAFLGYKESSIKLLHASISIFAFFPFLGAYLWVKGYKIARGYTLASSLLSITLLIAMFRFAGALETNEVIIWLSRSGFIIEGIVLSIALADRIVLVQKKHDNEQMRIQQLLENEVAKRTQELQKAKEKAETLARHDSLTSLWNRRAFTELGEAKVRHAHRYNLPLSLILLDIDHFKQVNDTYGHETGDEVLKAFSKLLSENTREGDVLARIGGEEFVIVMEHAPSEEALKKAEHYRRAIETLRLEHNGHTVNITSSLGVSTLMQKDTLDTLMAKADQALYHVKTHGRNGVHMLFVQECAE